MIAVGFSAPDKAIKGRYSENRIKNNYDFEGEEVMQIKLAPENVEPMLNSGQFKISQRSENQIEATKPFDYGKIHMRLKREKSNYLLQERYHWLANIHFERGLRPQRFFDSKKVYEFAEKYVIPYAKSE
jgi:hypothetical protein